MISLLAIREMKQCPFDAPSRSLHGIQKTRRANEEMNRFLGLFLNYGLVAAVLVWAATVALMAYHLKDSPWRWAFILLSLAGLGTIGIIFWIRKYVNRVTRGQQEVGKAQ